MRVIESWQEMQELALGWKRDGLKIGFVPTMGALHDGHLALLREGRSLCDRLVLSIYVNPKQFGPNEDLSKYPRTKDIDFKSAEGCNVDVIFYPSDKTIYPDGYQTSVEVTDVTKGLCGEKRPGHFKGVATVVLKLFNIVGPDVATFGEKDFQQLVVIKTMVRDLNLPIKIVGVPTIREADGLATSSRNRYLSKEERQAALSISKSLNVAKELVTSGERDTKKIITAVTKAIESARLPKIDYVKICDTETLLEITKIDGPARLLIAAFLGKTRLIDNCQL